MWSIANTQPVPATVVLGVVGVGAAAGIASLTRLSPWYSLVATVPFAWAIGFHGEGVPVGWAQALVTFAASAGAILVSSFDDAWREEAPGLALLAITVAGMYATVPDTEAVAAVLGVALPLVVLGWPFRLARLGHAGAAAAIAALAWAGAVGARGRPASIIGFVSCLGLLAATPVSEALLPRAGAWLGRRTPQSVIPVLVVAHVTLVIVASRVVGQVSDPLAAAAIGAVVAIAATLVGAQFRPGPVVQK